MARLFLFFVFLLSTIWHQLSNNTTKIRKSLKIKRPKASESMNWMISPWITWIRLYSKQPFPFLPQSQLAVSLQDLSLLEIRDFLLHIPPQLQPWPALETANKQFPFSSGVSVRILNTFSGLECECNWLAWSLHKLGSWLSVCSS